MGSKTHYPLNTILTAMCLWEELSTNYAETDYPNLHILRTYLGTCELRSYTLTHLAPAANKCWKQLSDVFDGVFDWEFCPLFLKTLDTTVDTHILEFDSERQISDSTISHMVTKIRNDKSNDKILPQMQRNEPGVTEDT